MTKQEIKKRVEQIEINKRDYEGAHCLEDQLFEDFIKYIASGGTDLEKKAKEILKSKEIDFERYTA